MPKLAPLVVLALVAGCGGGSAMRTRAAEAVADTRIALTDVESTTGGDDAAVRDALDRSMVRLEETEHALDLWRGATGSLAYERMAACLAASLDALRDALREAEMPISMELESAEAALGTTTDRECAHASGGD